MFKENTSQEFRLKIIDETRKYFIEERNKNKLMNKKYKQVCRVLNYIKHFTSLVHSVHWVITPHSKKSTPFFSKVLLNLQTVQAPLTSIFRQSPYIYIYIYIYM